EFTELKAKEKDHIAVLDVREPGEVALGAIENSVRIPLGSLASRTNELDPAKLIVVHCQGGYRSSIATSILRRAGFRDIANLTGGFDAWQAARHAASSGTGLTHSVSLAIRLAENLPQASQSAAFDGPSFAPSRAR